MVSGPTTLPSTIGSKQPSLLEIAQYFDCEILRFRSLQIKIPKIIHTSSVVVDCKNNLNEINSDVAEKNLLALLCEILRFSS